MHIPYRTPTGPLPVCLSLYPPIGKTRLALHRCSWPAGKHQQCVLVDTGAAGGASYYIASKHLLAAMAANSKMMEQTSKQASK